MGFLGKLKCLPEAPENPDTAATRAISARFISQVEIVPASENQAQARQGS